MYIKKLLRTATFIHVKPLLLNCKGYDTWKMAELTSVPPI